MFEEALRSPVLLLVQGAPSASVSYEGVLAKIETQLRGVGLGLSDVYEVWTGHTEAAGIGGVLRQITSNNRIHLVLWPGHWSESGRKGASRRDGHMLAAALGMVTFAHTEPRHVCILCLSAAGQRMTLERATDQVPGYRKLWTFWRVDP